MEAAEGSEEGVGVDVDGEGGFWGEVGGVLDGAEDGEVDRKSVV